FLGICLGLQLAVVESARDVVGLAHANSREFVPAGETDESQRKIDPVFDIMPEQTTIEQLGGTMRLGAWDCILGAQSLARRLYGRATISERHRHRYEVNNAYREQLQAAGLVLSGLSPDGRLVEMIELPSDRHP